MKDKHCTYKPRIVRGQVMMPADLSAFINICARLSTCAKWSKSYRGPPRAGTGREAELLGHLCESLPARLRDPHAHNVGLTTAGDHALALRGCESGLDQFDHHVDREPVRAQDRLGVTVTAPGKQFEGAAAVRIGAAIVASGRHRGTVTIIDPIRPAWERDGPGLSHVVLRPTRDLPPGSVRAQPNRPQGKNATPPGAERSAEGRGLGSGEPVSAETASS
jgi:hypothetical protein